MTGDRRVVEAPLSNARCGDCGSTRITKSVAERGPPVPATHRGQCQACGHRSPVEEFLAEAARATRSPDRQATLDDHLARSRDRQADADLDAGATDP